MRVQGQEYGPVDLDELREWKREGRLIRENEIREPGSERWIRAGELPEIFADEAAPPELPLEVVRRLSFGEMLRAGWRVYRLGFGRFFALTLRLGPPSSSRSRPYLEMPKDHGPVAPVIISVVVAFVMLVLLVIAWPFSLAGLQLLAADLYAGRNPTLRDLLTRAKPLWSRMFILGLIVYGSYFLWTVIPLIVAAGLATGATSFSSLLLMLLLLIFALYMVARLFINFLFWQQAGALGGPDAMEALRKAKIWRGAERSNRAGKDLSSWSHYSVALAARNRLSERRNRAAGGPLSDARRHQSGTSPNDASGDGDDEFARSSFRPNDFLELPAPCHPAAVARGDLCGALFGHEEDRAFPA